MFPRGWGHGKCIGSLGSHARQTALVEGATSGCSRDFAQITIGTNFILFQRRSMCLHYQAQNSIYSAPVLVFGRRHDEPFHALWRPASKNQNNSGYRSGPQPELGLLSLNLAPPSLPNRRRY
jgi:hypothetical protein